MSKRLTLKVVSDKFQELYPFGRITKVAAYSYEVMYDARDNRTEDEHIMSYSYGIKTDTRKRYTYKVNHLKELADRLKLDVTDKLDEINEYNKQPEETVKPANYDPNFLNNLFGKKQGAL